MDKRKRRADAEAAKRLSNGTVCSEILVMKI
jgi:hypothetical protein